ncbi:chemotaxis protein MotB [Thalassococcus profundi]|uniref:Chemotaxis protein MotB n=1 Tax=Thalassococcus profundi TaxID=2282382 RepID=A0A369TSF7_9RHOB|nr:flagellar motor protein MotB [Thalassococcus profundi]RDD68218.1 chemotaxis protein MotB [Thalassococcus profundi]
MKADSNVAPVIIKRKKVAGGDGHHGGAWKVAYADFVTAMMAFFMLMWLLNATTEKQRKGIADYFSPTIAISRVSGGGDGSFGGDSVLAENTLPRVGTGATSLRPTEADRSRGTETTGPETAEAGSEQESFEKVEDLLMGRGGESMVADDLMVHIITRVTDEGLVIELSDAQGAPLFDAADRPTRTLERLAGVIERVSDLVTNSVAIEGHVRSAPIVLASDRSWDVSARRAGTMRDLLMSEGMATQRVTRVAAHADREPVRDNRMDLRNNRIEVIYLRDN